MIMEGKISKDKTRITHQLSDEVADRVGCRVWWLTISLVFSVPFSPKTQCVTLGTGYFLSPNLFTCKRRGLYKWVFGGLSGCTFLAD